MFKKRTARTLAITQEELVEVISTTFKCRERKIAEMVMAAIRENFGRPMTKADLGLFDGP